MSTRRGGSSSIEVRLPRVILPRAPDVIAGGWPPRTGRAGHRGAGRFISLFPRAPTTASPLPLKRVCAMIRQDVYERILYFAHFANGGGTTSDLVFVNVSPRPSGPGPTPYHTAVSPSRPALYFYDQEGNLMDPASVVDLTGDLVVTEGGALSIQTEMEPLGELTISTHGRGELMGGSVKVVSEGPIGGVLRYALPGIGVTGVGVSQPVRDALFPVRQEGGLDTAAAIRNLSESDLVATCRLMKEGTVLEETEIPLAANGQESQYLEEMFAFTGADVSDFVGSVRCTVPPGEAMFTGVAVELDAGNRIFTTLPVVPVQRAADSQE